MPGDSVMAMAECCLGFAHSQGLPLPDSLLLACLCLLCYACLDGCAPCTHSSARLGQWRMLLPCMARVSTGEQQYQAQSCSKQLLLLQAARCTARSCLCVVFIGLVAVNSDAIAAPTGPLVMPSLHADQWEVSTVPCSQTGCTGCRLRTLCLAVSQVAGCQTAQHSRCSLSL